MAGALIFFGQLNLASFWLHPPSLHRFFRDHIQNNPS